MWIKTALACHGEVAPRCRFARKNYFYPICRRTYQISQYDEPLVVGGYIEIPTLEGMKRIDWYASISKKMLVSPSMEKT